jgi:carboxy-cis,cis-muconate cyclase
LRLSLDGERLYVTTRGKTPAEKGFVSVWTISQTDGSVVEEEQGGERGYGALSRYETETSGGKANAIEVFPFTTPRGERTVRDWIVLTDDELGWVTVLEWKGPEEGLSEVAKVQLGRQEGAEEDERGTGASHAVWLS